MTSPTTKKTSSAPRVPGSTSSLPLGGFQTSDTPPAERTTPPPAPDRPGKIAKWVTKQYLRVATVITPFDPVCGQAVFQAAEAAGLAWERMARENRTVRDIINRLMHTTVTTELLLAHLPLMIAVLTHHVPAFKQLVEKSSTTMLAEFLKNTDQNQDGTEAA